MPEQLPPVEPATPVGDPIDVEAEHRTLKAQMVVLRREHAHLHKHGGTHAEHQAHIARLREKIGELGQHVLRLKQRRKLAH